MICTTFVFIIHMAVEGWEFILIAILFVAIVVSSLLFGSYLMEEYR